MTRINDRNQVSARSQAASTQVTVPPQNSVAGTTAEVVVSSFTPEDPSDAARATIATRRERVTARARELIDEAKSALAAYWSVSTNRQMAGLTVARASLGVARLGVVALRTMPVAGSILNAVCALLDAAKATIRSAAFLRDEPNVEVRDLVGDWSRVAADVAGIFFPPAFLAGTATSAVVTAYGVAADRIRREHAEQEGNSTTATTEATTAPDNEPAP